MPAHPRLSVAITNWTSEHADDTSEWRFLTERAVAAERAGFDGVSVNDHLVLSDDMDDQYRAIAMGDAVQPTGPEGAYLEPLTSLAVIAGATKRVRLATGILLAALRRPAVLAKMAATLDGLSGGRLDLGVGVGWLRQEYDVVGLDFRQRGRLLDHTLEVCQLLWREPLADYDSDYLRFEGIRMNPKPVSPGGVPIWVSGTLNDRVVARLARFGAGWLPWGAEFEDVAGAIPRMRRKVEDLGRDPAEIGVLASIFAVTDNGGKLDPAATMSVVPNLVAAGVTEVRLWMPMSAPGAELDDNFGAMVAAFRDHVGAPEADSAM